MDILKPMAGYSIHDAVVVIGFMNLMLSVVEFMRPDIWAGFWMRWAASRFFRFHGMVLVAIAAVLFAAQPVPNLEFGVWFILLVMTVTGGAILLKPARLSMAITEAYKNRGDDEIRRFTYSDAMFRVLVGLCLIFSVTG
jgi:hypothetical protein